MSDQPKCSEGDCPNPANAIFNDSARGLYDPLCAAHVEQRKARYGLTMDQFSVTGLPSEPLTPATGTAALPSTVDHTSAPSALVGEHAALAQRHSQALEALDHQDALITKLQSDLDAARRETREHQSQRAVVESQLASAKERERMATERATKLAGELAKAQRKTTPPPA
jgi:hypothetical protein